MEAASSSTICRCSPQGLKVCTTFTKPRPWQRTINNYHHNVSTWLSLPPRPNCWCRPEVHFIFPFQADQINPVKCVLAKSLHSMGRRGKPVFLRPPGMTMSLVFLFFVQRRCLCCKDQSPQIALFGFYILRTSASFEDDEFFSNAPWTQHPTNATSLQRIFYFFFAFNTGVSQISGAALLRYC